MNELMNINTNKIENIETKITLVRPTERRKGYATEMLHQIIIIAKEAGLLELNLSVERDNVPSIKTIVKNGGENYRSFEYEGKLADVYKIVL
ncbi:MAG: GNAT family N-acetyltransferase [Lachnospiraceae bacterium]|nr:GNAT family N-acetyltransferase [Lachnospiraceae bacterium]